MADADKTETTTWTSLEDYRLLGNSGLRVSPLCMGCMTFGDGWEMGADAETSRKVYDLYREKGGNFFDTANVYQGGESERLLGEYISNCRSEVVVATKFSASPYFGRTEGFIDPNAAGNGKKCIREQLAASLRRLGTDFVDLYYLHIWDYRTPIEEVMRALDDCVRQGLVDYIALSDTPAWVCSAASVYARENALSPVVAIQTRYNLLDRSMEGDLWPMANLYGIAPVTWGTIAEGFLSGKYERGQEVTGGRARRVSRHVSSDKAWDILDVVKGVAEKVDRSCAEVCINWTIRRGVTAPLVGARTPEQLESNLAALDWEMSDEDFEAINAVSEPTDLPFPHSVGNDVGGLFVSYSGGSVETPKAFQNIDHCLMKGPSAAPTS